MGAKVASRLFAVLLLMAWAVGCTDTTPKPRIWQAPGLVYVSDPRDTVCEGVVETLISHRRAIVNTLRLDDEAVGQVRYHKFLDYPDLRKRGNCSPHSSACFFREVGIQSFQPFEQHELVHAYLAHLGDSHKLIEEGVAEALACGAVTPARPNVSVELAWSAAAWASTDVAELRRLYQAGAWFVAYLLKHYDRALFAPFYQRVQPGHEANEVAHVFEAMYGDDLATVWQRALTQPNRDGPCVYAFACSVPPISSFPHAPAQTADACTARPPYVTVQLDGTSWLGSMRSTKRARGATKPRDEDGQLGTCDANTVLPNAGSRSSSRGTATGDAQWLMPGAGTYWTTVPTNQLSVKPGGRTLVHPNECPTLEPLPNSSLDDVLFAVSEQSLAAMSAARGASPGKNDGLLAASGSGHEWVMALDRTGAVASRVRSECSPNVRVDVCESCAYTACQPMCAGAIGRAVVLTADTPRVRLTVDGPGDVWFRFRRISP